MNLRIFTALLAMLLDKNCPDPSLRHATRDRKSGRHPTSQSVASPLRTSQGLIRTLAFRNRAAGLLSEKRHENELESRQGDGVTNTY
jgi:hypothetical protein